MAGLRTDRALSDKSGVGKLALRRLNAIRHATRIGYTGVPRPLTIEALENRQYLAGQTLGQPITQAVLFPATMMPSNASNVAENSRSAAVASPRAVTVPTVTAVSPTQGPPAGGTTVTITGTNFTGATAVDFGAVAGTIVTVVSSTQITATSPAESAGSVDVTVTTPNGVSATSPADQFTFAAAMATAPTVTAVAPTTGPVAGGTTVTITGTKFTGATGVKFGTVAGTNVTVVSDTQITATSPAEAAGAVNVTVTTANGTSATSASDQFTFGAAMTTAPTVTAVAPATGPVAGGTTVTITGTNFTGATGVKFGTLAGTNVTVVSDTQITATSPAEAAATVNVTVTTANGTSATSPADQFTFAAPMSTTPTVTGIAPTSGPVAGGTTVIITGTNFTGVTGVKFGTVVATSFNVVSSTQITAVTPAEAASTVNVTVTTANGTSATSASDQFTFGAVTAGNIIQVTTGADQVNGMTVPGSLRAAIVAANAAPGSTIEFATLPAATPIVLDADLPPLTGANTTIDGTTYPAGRVEIDGNRNKPTNASGAGTGVTALDVEAKGVTIQGLSLKFCSTAIYLESGSGNGIVVNNYIGDVTASGSGANAIGIEISSGSSNNIIGGTTAAAANVISGNINTTPTFTGTGILISSGFGGSTTGNIVEGNLIGLTPTGTAAAGNGRGVVLADVQGNTVENNQICGSTYALGPGTGNGQGTSTNGGGAGVVTVDFAASDMEFNNTIEDNFIGITAAGTAEPNQIGVYLDNGIGTLEGDTFSGNMVSENTGFGFDVAGTANIISTNTIASNGGTGVVVATTAERNTISQNSISLNGTTSGGGLDLGIDLGNDGVTADSATGGTTNTGANGLTPYPTLAVTPGTNFDTVTASLTANPSTNYTIEFFTNTAATESTSGFGQGLTFISAQTLTTDASGIGTLTTAIPVSELSSDLTATATDKSAYDATTNPQAGATSEFSGDVSVSNGSESTSPITLNIGDSVVLREGHTKLDKTDANFSATISGPFTVTVDYGDGTGLQSAPYNGNDQLSLVHQYDGHVSHTYVVTVTVYTTKAAVKHQFDVTIINNPPHALTVKSLTRAAVTTAAPFQATGRFLDAGAGNGDFFRVYIDYGDGSKISRTTITTASFSLNHHYTHKGSYKLLVTVIDDGGGVATYAQTIKVFAPLTSKA